MERKMRRSGRAIPKSKALNILRTGEYGTLSTVSVGGQPYGIPLNFSFADGVIYFHCALDGHKLENLRDNNKVSFCVVGKTRVLPGQFTTGYESVIVFGKAFELNGDQKHKGLVELLGKYSPGFMEKGLRYIESDGNKTRVFKIEIESMTGKSSLKTKEALSLRKRARRSGRHTD